MATGRLAQTLRSLQLQDGRPDVEARRREYVLPSFRFVLFSGFGASQLSAAVTRYTVALLKAEVGPKPKVQGTLPWGHLTLGYSQSSRLEMLGSRHGL